MRRLWTAATVGTLAVLGWSEWLNLRWSRTSVYRRTGGRLVVVVPGFRNRSTVANPINRWRVRIALRTVGDDATATIVCSGGAVAGPISEAELLAAYARSRPGFRGRLVLEVESRTSWQNVTQVLPLVADADRIAIASQPAHALLLRRYLRQQRPDLAERLVRAADYRVGEWLPAKPFLALYGIWALRGWPPYRRRPG